jgi:hypothetical protein
MRLWQAQHWRVRSLQLALSYTTAAGRIGAQFFGLMLNRFPVCAFFYNDSWHNPVRIVGLALGPFELSLCLLIRARHVDLNSGISSDSTPKSAGNE